MTLAYDGRCYLGWQVTKMGPSIEETLRLTLEKILQHPIILQAASRTDAGVHAEGQVVNFYSSKPCLDHRLHLSLNSLLPKDISILSIEKAPIAFHPTLDVIGKEYHYYFSLGQSQLPHHRYYAWHIPYSLNLIEMQQAYSHLIGTHDFRAFCNSKNSTSYTHFQRHIDSIFLDVLADGRLRIAIRGHHFLYKMVRNIVGTLIYVGRGKFTSDDLRTILHSHQRSLAGVTAPAHGLFLYRVFYPDHRPCPNVA